MTLETKDEIEEFKEIVNIFLFGNFSQGIQILKDKDIRPPEFGELLEEYCKALNVDMYRFAYGYFDYNFFISLGAYYN